ncbi:tRNA-dihydrouridine synthase [Moorella thermoacetica Y72]|uniref:tRNA-dihydrouridine synthase n=1 Tax=Moorella thermoacetica Y72 TaxID=1325331 RepID=A0A0S6UC79_NEOTH|nr:tRNA-dihydrouridine synthase [Moorella thermoacetica Y72]
MQAVFCLSHPSAQPSTDSPFGRSLLAANKRQRGIFTLSPVKVRRAGRLRRNSVVGNHQMPRGLIVSVLKTNLVSFVKGPDFKAVIPVEVVNKGRIFNYQHKSCPACASEISCQALLVGWSERHPGIGAEITIIGRVQEDKILRPGGSLAEKLFEIQAKNPGLTQVFAYFTGFEVGYLTGEILIVIRNTAVRDVKFAPTVITKHGGIAVFPDKVKEGGGGSRAQAQGSGMVVQVAAVHVESTFKGAFQVGQDIPAGQGALPGGNFFHPGYLVEKVSFYFPEKVFRVNKRCQNLPELLPPRFNKLCHCPGQLRTGIDLAGILSVNIFQNGAIIPYNHGKAFPAPGQGLQGLKKIPVIFANHVIKGN